MLELTYSFAICESVSSSFEIHDRSIPDGNGVAFFTLVLKELSKEGHCNSHIAPILSIQLNFFDRSPALLGGFLLILQFLCSFLTDQILSSLRNWLFIFHGLGFRAN